MFSSVSGTNDAHDCSNTKFMIVHTFARFAVCDGLGWITVVTFFTVMAIPSSCVVAALETDSATDAAGQFE